MGTSSKLAGVRLEDYNHLKYTIGVIRVGQEVFTHVFSWGFIGGSGSIKDTLFSLPQYSHAKFRKDFNASQRDKITNGVPVSEFDITLTYKLLQLVCGLSEANDSVWVTETSDSLEYCLYSIKSKRNETAHESVRLSPSKMIHKIEDLRKLFVSTIQKAGQRYSVESARVKTLLTSINSQLDAIKDSPVPLTTVTEYQRELSASRKACVIEEGINESTQIFDSVCQVSVAPWLIAGRTVNVAQVFTHPRLKRDETQIIQRQLSASESYVSVCDVVQATDCDGTRPDMTMISALNGMGKTTLLKYIIDTVNDAVARGSADNFDLILFLECRQAAFTSLDELVALLLPRTAAKFQQSEFRQTLLSLDLLLIVDDLNELDKKSSSVFKDFLSVMTPGTRVLTTASREKAKDLQKSVSALHKRVLFLEIEGIPEDQTLPFLQRTLNHVSPTTTADQDSERKLCHLISSKRLCLQEHLRSPEILSLIALSWALAPDGLNSSTTVTEIFMLVEDLLIHKVLQNLLGSSLPGISTKNVLSSKLRKYLTSLSSVAAACTRNGKFIIDPEYVMKLATDCQTLGLPEDYMISAFLNYTDESVGKVSIKSPSVSFPRRSTIAYYAAWYMSQDLRNAPPSKTIHQCLGMQSSVTEDHVPILQSVMKYFVGILAVLLPGQLERRAREIVDFLKDLELKKASQWLQYIEESKEETAITQLILREMGQDWEVEDFAISSTFVNVIKKRRPQQLVLTVLESPMNYPHLQEVLKVCAQFHEMRLSLHLYKHFWSEKTDVSDKFLNTVVNGTSPCMLESFAGRLSNQAITRLPSSLKKVALHITPDMLGPLNTVLPSLTALQMLYLNLDASATTDPNTVPSLNICGRSIVLSLDIWKINETTIEWSCDVAKALSTAYARLVLRLSNLDSSGCERWLAALHQRGVTASWVVVGSTCDVAGDNDRLEQCAAKIGCRKFVWIKV